MATDPIKPKGSYGPNDYWYINNHVRRAAQDIVYAINLYCEGHYAHSNARDIPLDHPLCIALNALAETDKQTAMYANLEHEPKLFEIYKPSDQAKNRWNPDYPRKELLPISAKEESNA
jgi:hypothetical protein